MRGNAHMERVLLAVRFMSTKDVEIPAAEGARGGHLALFDLQAQLRNLPSSSHTYSKPELTKL